jgi:outer membrane protein with beta-barrel domain
MMKRLIVFGAVLLLTPLVASPLFAQDHTGQIAGWENAKGYVTGLGGFASSTSNTTGNVEAEAGVRLVPHVLLFGNIGRFSNLLGDLQPTLDATTAGLAANQLSVVASGTLPATYYGGGLRVEIPTHSRAMPYVLGGMSVAHLTPTATFTFSSGVLPDGSTPDTGTDVTSTITASGAYVPPLSSNAAMFTMGAGVQVLTMPHWVVDAGYRYSRIAADTTLNASTLATNGMTFGISYRF